MKNINPPGLHLAIAICCVLVIAAITFFNAELIGSAEAATTKSDERLKKEKCDAQIQKHSEANNKADWARAVVDPACRDQLKRGDDKAKAKTAAELEKEKKCAEQLQKRSEATTKSDRVNAVAGLDCGEPLRQSDGTDKDESSANKERGKANPKRKNK